MTKKKIIAAMSGGVDSSVATAVYVEKGYDVTGVTLRLHSGIMDGEDGCASPEDEEHARKTAELLGIKHICLDYSGDFVDEVLRPSWDEFSSGRTPNPCTLCNPKIKFGKLLEYADEIGAEGVVTGHYANIIEDNGVFKLERGSDPTKDQTYFLFGLTQKMVSRIHFPIGNMTKDEVRKYAQKLKLKNHAKKDSQDTCFSVPGESFQESLRKLFNGKARKGEFITDEGKSCGKHSGIHQYTIGQRKGLGVALGKPAYVSSIDADSGKIVITTNNANLMTKSFEATDLNWQSGTAPSESFDSLIQVRYRSRPVKGTIHIIGNDRVLVEFKEPQRAVTTGQAAVFYDGQLLIGGGYIESVEK